jgi:hypothetical protein
MVDNITCPCIIFKSMIGWGCVQERHILVVDTRPIFSGGYRTYLHFLSLGGPGRIKKDIVGQYEDCGRYILY